MFESIKCLCLHARTPRVHVLPSLTATCQVCALSLKAGQSTYKVLAWLREGRRGRQAVRGMNHTRTTCNP
jgi:hypothetical protein